MKRTVSDVESLLQHAFQSLPNRLDSVEPAEIAAFLNPEGFEPVIEVQENGRKKRRDTSVDKLDFEEIEYRIYFVRSNSESPSPSLPKELASPVASIRHNAGKREPLPPRASPIPPTETSNSLSARTQRDVVQPPSSTDQPITALRTPTAVPSAVDELCSALEEVERQARPFVALKWFRDEVLSSKSFGWVGTTEERQTVLAKAVESGRVVTSRIPNPRSPYPTTTIRLNRSRVSALSDGPRYNPRPIRGTGLSETILRDRGIR